MIEGRRKGSLLCPEQSARFQDWVAECLSREGVRVTEFAKRHGLNQGSVSGLVSKKSEKVGILGAFDVATALGTTVEAVLGEPVRFQNKKLMRSLEALRGEAPSAPTDEDPVATQEPDPLEQALSFMLEVGGPRRDGSIPLSVLTYDDLTYCRLLDRSEVYQLIGMLHHALTEPKQEAVS